MSFRDNAPLVFTDYAPFVTVPTNVGTDESDNRIWLTFSYNLVITEPIVFLNVTVFIGLCGTVKTNVENITVFC